MERKLFELMSTLEMAAPPDGLKERVLSRLLFTSVELSRFQRLIFSSPLRAAGIVAVVVSGMLWAILGDSYAMIFTSILR